MPTGYTSDLYEGKDISFEEFVLKCARGMGAAILQRDDPPGPIKEMEPSDYYLKAVESAKQRVASIEAWDTDEAAAEESRTRAEEQRYYDEYVENQAALRLRYEAMLEQVQAWEPPTTEHEGFKTFMVDQLERSIEFDTSGGYLPSIRTAMSAEDYKQLVLQKARDGLTRAVESLAEEQERTAGRNGWIKALRESLEGVPA